MNASIPPALQFTLKVTSRCNIACRYCYVYETGDNAWRSRPRLMAEETFEAALARIVQHSHDAQQRTVDVVFHGGEPTLLGKQRFARWCVRLREALGPLRTVKLSIQTNATLVDAEWAEIFREADVTVGVSLDGTAEVNDLLRIDHRGRGTHSRVVRGIEYLKSAGIPLHLLSVVPLGTDPLPSFDHLTSLEPKSIAYLLPDHTHDSIDRIRAVFGPNPCADFLTPILERWWHTAPATLTVQPFKEMARAILGGSPRVDFIGNQPSRYAFIETDGTIEGLDVLRICGPDTAKTGLNIFDNRIADVITKSDLHELMMRKGMPLPGSCASCPEVLTCGGGYVPHRFKATVGFDNPSVWCRDLLMLFGRLRELLGVDPQETLLRRKALDELAEGVRSDTDEAEGNDVTTPMR